MKWLKYLFLLACAVFAILVLASLFDYFYFYEHYVAKAARLTGLNTYLLKAIGVIIFVPFVLGIKWVFDPFSALTRRQGYITTCSAIAVYNLAFFFITRDQNFSVEDGKSMRWYSIREGRVFYYDRKGTDPVIGTDLKPVTAENAARLRRWERGETARVEPSESRFFSTMTGEPLLWYAKSFDGGYEFFDGPGFHPTSRAVLAEVTPEVVQDWQSRRPVPPITPIAVHVQPALPKPVPSITPIAVHVQPPLPKPAPPPNTSLINGVDISPRTITVTATERTRIKIPLGYTVSWAGPSNRLILIWNAKTPTPVRDYNRPNETHQLPPVIGTAWVDFQSGTGNNEEVELAFFRSAGD